MLYVEFRYVGRSKRGEVFIERSSQTFDVDEPSSADEMEELERRVAAEIHKQTGCHFSDLDIHLLNWKTVKRADPYDIISRLPWIDKNDRPFPIFERDKEGIDHGDFLAAWIHNGYIEGIEWYTYTGHGEYWNQNSNNLNEFDDDHELRSKHGPTHWLPVPRGNKRG